jgi:hypothetical protein
VVRRKVGEPRGPLRAGATGAPAGRHVGPVLVAAAAFGLYWLSSLVLEARDATLAFGADTWVYAELARGNVLERIGGDYLHDRIIRFHPLTVAMTAAWTAILGPLAHWITPRTLLKAMFAAAGAVGVWAAMRAFAAVVPRRYVLPLGAIYAATLGVWYFSSVEESKAITAALTALYIAIYLHLRTKWSLRGAALLTAILLLACLNEIVAGFLVLVPAVDTLVRRGWDMRHGRWIAWHGLAVPLAFVFLEVAIKGRLVGAGPDAENASHLSMLFFYVSQNDFSAASLYGFLLNWLLFNIAAPASATSYALPAQPTYKAYFEPALGSYFSSPVSAALVVMLAAALAASLLPRHRGEAHASLTGILPALAAYAGLRGAFFFIINPGECILFASGATLAHLLLIGMPFAASRVPAKQGLLAGFAVLLLVVNAAFIFGT